MKFTLLALAVFSALVTFNGVTANPAGAPAFVAENLASCGAAGSCEGFGGADLCNDRCKRCSGTTGPYDRGDCCGFLE